MVSVQDQSTLGELIDRLQAGRVSRRHFITGATKFGLSASLAGAIFQAAKSRGTAAAGVSLQDGGKTLVVALPQSTVQLDPAIAGTTGYGDIIPINENLYEGLTRYKNGAADIEPALAESWTVSEDGLTYVFKIRPNVTFHDGTPLDAKAVETNFLRQIDPKNPLHQDGMVYAEIVFAEVDTVKATGDLDLTITLKRPIILVPGNLAIFAAGIVSPTALQQFGKDYSNHAAGTGPFKLDHWTKDVELVFVANDKYWGGRPKLDRIVWRSIPDDTVRLTELTSGGLDIANQIDFKDVESLKSDPNEQVISGTFWNLQYLGMNQSLAPFDNPSVRKALQYAINKQNIFDVVFFGNYTIGAGPVAPGLLGYDESLAQVYTYDADKAKSLLQEAGLSNVSFDLYNRSNSFWPTLGQLIQADLDAVGIKANLKSLQDADFFALIGDGKAPAFINDWTWDNADPDNIMYALFASDRAQTRLGYKNDQVIQLVTDAQTEKDSGQRTEQYQQAQKLILDDAINVFLGYPDRIIGAAKKVQGLVLSPIGNMVLRDVDIS
ncbi:MAG: ABC transporter substrate-binding protein [Thermomicrobiales bacterium]